MIKPLHEFLDEQEGVNNERFTVENEEQANWALRKMKQIETDKNENLALAQAEIDKIEAWMEQVTKQAENELSYFQGLLAEYAFKRRKEDKKFKSLKLPNGKIRFQKQQPKWNYDDKKLLEVLKKSKREDLIRTKEEPDKSTIKKQFVIKDRQVIDPETGEIVEGITVEHRDEQFKWEVT